MKKEYSTKVNEKILEYIKLQKENSFDTKSVYNYIITQDIDVNLTTIYRNLERMAQKNILVKFKSANSSACLYRVVDVKSNCHRHLHMQCRLCKKIYHLEGEFMNNIDNYIKNQFNFNIECEDSLLIGVCYECSKK